MAKTLVSLIVLLCLAFPAVAAQSKAETKKPPKHPWSELSPPQQKVLAPLQEDWEYLDTTRRTKWIKIADRYPTMKPPAQQRLQIRMQEWAKLSPEERRAAREKYQTLKKMPAQKRDQVNQKWQEYQQTIAPPPAAPAAN